MPEDETVELYLARIRQLTGQDRAKIAALEQTIAHQQKEMELLQTRNAELQEMTRYATTLDLVSYPTLLLRQDNVIHFANQSLVDLLGHDISVILDQPVAAHVRGVEFLEQIRLEPVLMQVEDLQALEHVPVTLVTKQGEELLRSAEINFLTPPRAYHGVRLALKPKEERTLLQRTRQHIPRYLGGPTEYDKFDAGIYAHKRRLIVRGQPAEKSAPLDGTHLLTAITKTLLELDNPQYTRRGVVVDFREIDDCDTEFYTTLSKIAALAKLPLKLVVYEHSSVHQELVREGISQEYLVKERKKKK